MSGSLWNYGAPLLVAGLLAGGPALAEDTPKPTMVEKETVIIVETEGQAKRPAGAADQVGGAAIVEELDEAQEIVAGAQAAIQKMKADPDLAGLMARAKGIYIVPEFAKGAIVVGGWGGEGVVLSNLGGSWSGPAFYDIAAVSAGAEIGFSSGTVAFLLMNDEVMNDFRTENTFSLNANAELTILEWSKAAQASLGKGDVILWSDTEGAFVGAGASVSDITWDEEKNNSYYRDQVTAQEVLSGQAKNPAAQPLQNALPG